MTIDYLLINTEYIWIHWISSGCLSVINAALLELLSSSFSSALITLCKINMLKGKRERVNYERCKFLPANFLNPSLNSSSTSWCSALEGEWLRCGLDLKNKRRSLCVLWRFHNGTAYMWDKVIWVTEGRLISVCSVSWVRWGTVPKCVYSRHPGISSECCPVLPSPFRTPSRLLPWTTRDSSSCILLPAIAKTPVEALKGLPPTAEIVRVLLVLT